MTFFLSIFKYLLQYEVELCFCLVHLVSLEQTKVSSTEKMVRVVHDDLIGSGVEKRSLDGIKRERERERERERDGGGRGTGEKRRGMRDGREERDHDTHYDTKS